MRLMTVTLSSVRLSLSLIFSVDTNIIKKTRSSAFTENIVAEMLNFIKNRPYFAILTLHDLVQSYNIVLYMSEFLFFSFPNTFIVVIIIRKLSCK